jgi:molybdate transport system regulatory protein
MTAKISKSGLQPRCKLWISRGDAAGAFGDGKWRLLMAISREGSLQGAARSLTISYRKAWGDLRKAEASLGCQLVDRHRGGRSGGDMQLTAMGEQWLQQYGDFRRGVERAVSQVFEECFNEDSFR